MSKRIFHSTILVAIVVLISTVVLIMGILFELFEDQLANELKSKAEFISYGLSHEGYDFLHDFDGEGERITIIAPDGTVIEDTEVDASTLGNHGGREEVKEAFETGNGQSIRYSDTLMERIVYNAVLMDDGNVLRVSQSRYSVFAVLFSLLRPIVIVIAIALILSFILSERAAKKIVRPINAIDLDNPERNETYGELTPLLRKISSQRNTINAQLQSARHKQEEFTLITENMSEGFLVIDKDSTVLTYNTAALGIFGVSGENVGGSVFTFNRSREFRNAVRSALRGSKTESEMSLRDKSYRIIASPVIGDGSDGEVIGAVLIILDITESVERERLRREFTSNVSHELKTPLTSISGFAEMMKAGGVPEETVIDFSQAIYDEARRLIVLVNDIIRISELDEKIISYEWEKIDIYDLSCDVAKRLKPEADKHGVAISVSGEHTTVKGVGKILDELVYNIVENAVKYNKENGSVSIHVETENGRARLSVSDTGIGIPKEDLDRVFERFYRVDKSHSKLIGGTGLGLSIVKHAASFHGASVSLESTQGVGTTLSVLFAPSEND